MRLETLWPYLALLLASGCLTGCGVANPRTEISYGPFGFSLHNSKDVTIRVKKAGFNAETKDFEVEDLEVFDDASSVRIANVEQLKLVNEQIRIHGENIAQSLGLITGLLEKVVPGFTAPRPAQPDDSARVLELLLKLGAAQARPVTP